ncbi:MAG TPA: membrane protein insertase YidC [Verrucomicrobiae bacterium]|nr:membrane protein insertase YidC [Verrucomicrobiae bacterium]
MDKKTVLVVVACLIALFAWQTLVNKIYPPKPKPPRPAAAAVTNAPQPQAEIPPTVEKPAAAPPTKAAMVEPEEPRPAEQTVTLTNDYVRMEFTSWGGGVRQVELLKHKTNGSGNVVLNGGDFVPALALDGVTNAGPDAAYTVARPAADVLVMRRRTREGLEVTKTFRLGEGYLLSNTVEIARAPQAGGPLPTTVELTIGTAAPANPKEPPNYLSASWLVGEKYQYRDLGHIAKYAAKGISNETVNARWGAVKDQFFTMILTPSTNAVEIAYHEVELPRPADWKAKQPPHGVSAALKLVPMATTSNGTERYVFTWYAGPKEYERLVALHGGQEEVMQFGFWSVISVVLLKSMKFFYGLIPNYGVAIIIITILIKILFWPVQAKSIKSMKAMQKFQPLMTKLREKYKDDPQRLNTEMMKLYKEHKINPFAGCLPMAVQIPVFFALFAMLRSAVELRGASFLWIKDLSQPDTVAHLLGFPVNPLPIAMGVSMIWQMKLTPSGGDPKQQQMMMFMPLMMLFFFYSSSSGLVLYWTVQQFLSIAQQWWSMRQADTGARAVPVPSTGKTK